MSVFSQLIATATATKAAKAAPKVKAAAKAAPAAAAYVTGGENVKYCLSVGRPQGGNALFAHTAAFFLASGMIEGKAAPIALARKVLGDTAVSYHTTKTGFLERTPQGLVFTDAGWSHFAARFNLDVEKGHGFYAMMTRGELDPRISAHVKNAAFIVRAQ